MIQQCIKVLLLLPVVVSGLAVARDESNNLGQTSKLFKREEGTFAAHGMFTVAASINRAFKTLKVFH